MLSTSMRARISAPKGRHAEGAHRVAESAATEPTRSYSRKELGQLGERRNVWTLEHVAQVGTVKYSTIIQSIYEPNNAPNIIAYTVQ